MGDAVRSESWQELEKRAAEAVRDGDPPQAIALYLEAATKGAGAGEGTPGWAHAMRHVAELQRKLGELDAALTNARAVVAFYREQVPLPLEMANALRVLGLAHQARGEEESSGSCWTEARALYAQAGVDAGVHEADVRLREIGLH
jgi:tetratricopeptide (TPR) repeat protein